MLEPSQWEDAVAAAKGVGYDWFELLSAYDNTGRGDGVVVVLRLRGEAGTKELAVVVGADTELPDISHLFAGASWGQRYVHDFYGVRFTGADLRPLLNHEGGAPLRKPELADGGGAGRRRRRR